MYYMIIWCSFRKFQLSINKIFSPSRINLLSTTWISLLSFKHFSNLPMLTFKVPVEENQTLEVNVLLSKSEHTGQLAYCNDLTFCLRCRRSGSVKRYWRHGLEVSIFFYVYIISSQLFCSLGLLQIKLWTDRSRRGKNHVRHKGEHKKKFPWDTDWYQAVK